MTRQDAIDYYISKGMDAAAAAAKVDAKMKADPSKFADATKEATKSAAKSPDKVKGAKAPDEPKPPAAAGAEQKPPAHRSMMDPQSRATMGGEPVKVGGTTYNPSGTTPANPKPAGELVPPTEAAPSRSFRGADMLPYVREAEQKARGTNPATTCPKRLRPRLTVGCRRSTAAIRHLWTAHCGPSWRQAGHRVRKRSTRCGPC